MKLIVFLLSIMLFSTSLFALDEVRVVKKTQEPDKRDLYSVRILKAALEATVETDGPYIIKEVPFEFITRKRSFALLKRGEVINVHGVPTQKAWEEAFIPIFIPITKGLLGYRLFLIHYQDSEKFSQLKSLDDLKKLRAGLHAHWSTTRIMTHLGFNIVKGMNYEGLFAMLASKRFDYFPRGVNEIYREFDSFKNKHKSLRIESTKAMYLPTPRYFFVSPKYPKLADRIERGMEKLIANGTYERMFYEEFGENIKKARLEKRTIFRVDNPLLSKETPLDRPELWY